MNEVNKFELVFNEATDSSELKNLPIHNENALIGIIHEEDEEEDNESLKEDNDCSDCEGDNACAAELEY